MNLLKRLQKQRAYWQTVAELKNLPLDTALDLGIYRGDAEKLAQRAVYGR